jgi:hypothetical protein
MFKQVNNAHTHRPTRSLPTRRGYARANAPLSGVPPHPRKPSGPLGPSYSLRPTVTSPAEPNFTLPSDVMSRALPLPSGLVTTYDSPFSSQTDSITSSAPLATPPSNLHLHHYTRVAETAGSSMDEYFPPPLDFSDVSPEPVKQRATPMLPLHDRELSRKERDEHYHLVAAALGPGSGSQELQGTYRAFMELQTQEYYSPLDEYLEALSEMKPVSVHPTHVPSPSGDCGLFGSRKPQDTRKEDFKKWLAPVGCRVPASRESSVTLSEDSFSSRHERRGIAEFIQSRRSSACSSLSSIPDDSGSPPIPFEDVPPIMFGHVSRQTLTSLPAPVSAPPPPSTPALAHPIPIPAANFATMQQQSLATPDQELINTYLFAASPRLDVAPPAPPALQPHWQPPVNHGWYAPLPHMESYMSAAFPVPHPPPAPSPAMHAPQPELLVLHSQLIPTSGFHAHGMPTPAEHDIAFGPPMAYQQQQPVQHYHPYQSMHIHPTHPPSHIRVQPHLLGPPHTRPAATKPEWMDWQPL